MERSATHKSAFGVRALAMLATIVATLAIVLAVAPTGTAYAEEKKVADDITAGSAEEFVVNSTKDVGRIWTDKSVVADDQISWPMSDGGSIDVAMDGSDFLVTLSALSSTSNVITKTDKPLDIVLVLDVSGSMDESIYSYDAIYESELKTNSSYYILVDEEYVRVSYKSGGGWGYSTGRHNSTWHEVDPKDNASDSAGVQFYERTSTTKMTALKDAVNSFVDSVAKQNESQAADKKHAISLVKFAGSKTSDVGDDSYQTGGHRYNWTQVVKEMAVCDESAAQTLKGAVDGLDAYGCTCADYGLELAAAQLSEHGRKGAQKVVIFFTDGEPNRNSGFDESVANRAISTAKEMKKKENDTLVYAIGVFSGADPSDTSGRFNAYMNGVSSNYPSANTYKDLGARASSGDYYKTAADASELASIFGEISDELSQNTGFPTTVAGDGAGDSGFVTFNDALGSGMQVDGMAAIIVDGQKFENPVKATSGNVDTYTFSGSAGNVLYEQGNLSQVKITVTRGSDLATGDVVEVSIPAGLIPLANYQVKEVDGELTMSVDPALPITVVYGVSLKDGVEQALAEGSADAALLGYVSANTDDDGKIAFYSNAYDSAKNETHGSTTSRFAPNVGNGFYFMKSDELLYEVNEEGETGTLATQINPGKKYYYVHEYYTLENGVAVETSEKIYLSSDAAEFGQTHSYVKTNADGNLYLAAGTPELSHIHDFIAEKGEGDKTGTASLIIDPTCEDVSNPEYVVNYLGNNGKLAIDAVGALEISKDAVVAAGLDESLIDPSQSFAFNVELKDAAGKAVSGTFDVKRTDANGTVVTETITFDESGKASISLCDGEKVVILGIPAGANYTVSEDASSMPAGYSQVFPEGKASAQGAIATGVLSQTSFENEFNYKPVTTGDTAKISAKKVLAGNLGWADSMTFQFKVEPVAGAPALTDGKAAVSVGKPDTGSEATFSFDFSGVTFTKPGTYTYVLSEVVPSSPVPGMTYSEATYLATVSVAANDKMELVVSGISLTKATTDSGADFTPGQLTSADVAVFTNTYQAGSVGWSPSVTKNYTDAFGQNPLKDGMFEFKLEALTEGAPMPKEGEATASNFGNTATFGQITFTEATETDAPYRYRVTEVIPGDAVNGAGVKYEEATPEQKAAGGFTLAGVTYDSSVYEVAVTVTAQTDGASKVLSVSASYQKQGDTNASSSIVFDNSYRPASVTKSITGEGQLTVMKMLEGRDISANEFKFELLDETGEPVESVESHHGAAQADASGTAIANVTFDAITYTEPGTYVYTIREVAGNAGGVSYDEATYTVYAVVTDNGKGSLEVKHEYSKADMHGNGLVFRNFYEPEPVSASVTDSIAVSKSLAGGTLAEGDFQFVLCDAATGAEIDRATNAADGSVTFGDIEYTEAGTYSYYAFEVIPDDAVNAEGEKYGTLTEVSSADKFTLDGVTYDASVYEIKVTVADDGKGNLSVSYAIADPDATAIEFKNSYATTPVEASITGEGGFTITKLLDKAEPEADAFSFELLDESGEVIRTAANDAEGNIEFASIRYTAPGEYAYTVREAVPADAKNAAGVRYADATSEQKAEGGFILDGIVYDTWEHAVYASVVDNGDGTLAVSFAGEVEGVREITFENTSVYESVTVTKVWVDDDNKDGKRPASVEVRLVANGNPMLYETAVLSAENNWTYTWKNVEKYNSGNLITYEIVENEAKVEGYEATYSGTVEDGFVVTNTLVVEDPNNPEKPDTPQPPADGDPIPGNGKDGGKGLSQTGDGLMAVVAIAAGVAVAAVAVAVVARRKMHRGHHS